MACPSRRNSLPTAANEFSADSELMQFTHRKVLALPEYQRLAKPTSFIHCYGPANPCADAVSRGRFELLFQLCNQMGVAPVQIEVPYTARELLSDVCAFAERNGLLSDGPRRRLHSTAVELGAAAQVANGFGHRGTIGFEAEPGVAGRREAKRSRTDHVVRKPETALRHHTEPRRRPQQHALDTYQRTISSTTLGKTRAIKCHPVRIAKQSHDTFTVATAAAAERRERLHKRGRESSMEGLGGAHKRLSDAHVKPAMQSSVLAASHVTPGRRKGHVRLQEAIETRTLQLVEKLANDTSPLALRPNDTTKLHGLCAAHITTAQSVPAIGTLAADGTAWRRWVDYCEGMGTPPLRATAGQSPFQDPGAADRETILQSGFLMYLASIIEPRSKSAAAAKPQSGFNNLLAVRRVHQRLIVDFHIYRGASITLQAQVRAFIRENGPEALLPARKEPLDSEALRKIFSLSKGTKLGNRSLDWDNYFFLSYKALMCTGLAAAFRKAELCLPNDVEFTRGRLSVASVSWVIGGRAVGQASHEQLRALANGDYCGVKPPLCKNDPFGLHFGTKPIWLPVNASATNAARALAAMFLACPSSQPLSPETTALFRISPDGEPLRHGEADKTLRLLLQAAFPEADASRWSLHSLRIGAACALLAAKASPALIQAICRWRSTKSIEIYARLGPKDYGRYVLEIERQAVDAITTQRLHGTRIDYDNIVALLDGPVAPVEDSE